jgi:sortase (surface protein transpeptidase)
MRRLLTSILDRLRTRLVPAVITAAGIALIAAGLLSYSTPAHAEPPDATETPAISSEPSPTPSLLTFPPLDSPSPSAAGSPSVQRVVTRVTVPALGIDLPVVKPPRGFPYCNVAMYLDLFSQPGEKGGTYIFAHARTGMFLPLLTQSQRNNGQGMIGMIVQVYTSDDQLFLYRIFLIRRHYPASNSLVGLPVKDNQLWLQTSEGPLTSSTKLQVVAKLLTSGPADHRTAHPKARPVICG